MESHRSSNNNNNNNNSGAIVTNRNKYNGSNNSNNSSGNSSNNSNVGKSKQQQDQDKQDQLQQQQLALYKFSELPASYFICLIIRFLVGISSTGYIHPDEYFQSPEITSTSLFHIKTLIPWEFDPLNPCRSIIIPINCKWLYIIDIPKVFRSVFLIFIGLLYDSDM
ncbi:hypothetical protein PPL_03822 [Heterostelium album PN500]|uniref:Mannosyltransferase n=1 Tax=Heterostelium pallidum (strain ATCC 26659 / Pp 5 / PN500) TaxID=670386 RepID=D3B6R7_HETP5|nr:hypothetical protein PPL_03822 [Heterostelium album PN500]EFA83037.1 hypothetical protein PPL_03822 [Heterostelium album PN500]|eukprot:XP_020435154.1 hypothetical protein PPL_03822 [Heterostelium album PN500]